jgi:soluble calcium-activated nucleotidase 1
MPLYSNLHELTDNPDAVDLMIPIEIVSDMDRLSKEVTENEEDKWISYLKKGRLTRHAATGNYSVQWESEVKLTSLHSFKGRGMELSELIRYDGRLLAFDDTTGLVYQIRDGKVVPWQVLADGDGTQTKGFKTEWATIKGNLLYVGSSGKEWTNPQTAEVLSADPMWIKVISPDGHVQSVDWIPQYTQLRKASGTLSPGYLIHESGNWNEHLSKWVFLPRRVSTEPYNEHLDEQRASNIMLVADESFETVQLVQNIGPFNPIRGFSAFRFIPNHPTEFVALKTEEDDGEIATYITVLNMDGKVLMPETFISKVKFEGLEIMP